MVKKSSKVIALIIVALVVVGVAQTVRPKKEETVTIKVGDVSVTIPAGHEKEFREGFDEVKK